MSRPPYVAHPLTELLKQSQPLIWQVEHWIEVGTLAVLIGPEGSFKSFLAIDWSMAIASGLPWHGCRVEQGRVLYVAGEGRTGVIRRLRGWTIQHGSIPDDLLLGATPIELVGTQDAERIAELGTFDLVVIDTLARNFGRGNENMQQDMSAAIDEAYRIRDMTGAAVLVVHHAPLEGRDEGKLRPRGSSALPGAADAMFTCQYQKESKVITVGNTKQKDSVLADTRHLSFDVVDLDERDNFGNPITTAVLCETEKRPVTNTEQQLGKNQKALVRELRARANGAPELLVSIREITTAMAIKSRQSRNDLEDWFREQSWSRPSVGGDIVDIERLPKP